MPRKKQNRNIAVATQFRRTMTLPEVLLWQLLRKVEAPRFRRQHGIDHFVLDFYCPKAKVCVEPRMTMVANRLRVVVTAELGDNGGPRPLLARLAGDEFTMFFPKIDAIGEVEMLARRVVGAGRRRDAALSVTGIALGERRLGQDQDAAVLPSRQCGKEPGDPGTDDPAHQEPGPESLGGTPASQGRIHPATPPSRSPRSPRAAVFTR